VAEALAAVRRAHVRRSKGAVRRAESCVEDFFVRYDAALLGTPELAARSVQRLLDARADALNTLRTLLYERPIRLSGDVRKACGVVRRETQRCLMILANKHAGSPAMRANGWTPPYSFDTGKDPRFDVD
jgi:hypothetical protein